jgi:hypothetical protein
VRHPYLIESSLQDAGPYYRTTACAAFQSVETPSKKTRESHESDKVLTFPPLPKDFDPVTASARSLAKYGLPRRRLSRLSGGATGRDVRANHRKERQLLGLLRIILDACPYDGSTAEVDDEGASTQTPDFGTVTFRKLTAGSGSQAIDMTIAYPYLIPLNAEASINNTPTILAQGFSPKAGEIDVIWKHS